MFENEGRRLSVELRQLRDRLRVVPCADDPVSKDVALVCEWKIKGAPNSIFGQYLRFADNLKAAADQLKAAAHAYGFTDEDISGAFTRYRR